MLKTGREVGPFAANPLRMRLVSLPQSWKTTVMLDSLCNRVVFWDFDGTLATRQGGWWGGTLHDVLLERCPETGVTREMLSPYLQSGFLWHNPERSHTHLNDPDNWWRYMQNLLARALTKVGIGQADAAVCAAQVRQRYLDPSRWSVFDDAFPALEAVSQLGVPSIILSNHVPELEWLAGRLGLRSHVESVVTSALIGYEKPNPRVYEIALKKAGNPDLAYMIGDNPAADVDGPEAAGIRGILISRDGSRAAKRMVSSLLDVPDMLGLART